MTPYYDDGAGHVLYLGDCREVLPTLAAGSVDLVLTDPPYGCRWESGLRKWGHFGPIAGDDSPDIALEGLRLALRVLRRHRHIYAFGRYDLSGLRIAGHAELIWDKAIIGIAGNHELVWGKTHEYIQFAVSCHGPDDVKRENRGRWCKLRRGTVLRHPRVNGAAANRHPTEKPVPLLRELIEASSLIGETVLDPFVGVGSTLVAAALEGRGCIGVELEERYCEIAARHLEREALPLLVAP